MKKFKEIFEKYGLKKTLLELLSIVITLGIILSLFKLQNWAETNSGDIDFGKMGPVSIINAASGKYLSVSKSFSNGSEVNQFSKDETHLPVWQIEKNGEGWAIKIVNTNYCLEIDGASQENRTKSQIWDCVGAPQQIWKIERLEKGIYTLQPLHSGKCLEVNDSSTEDGAIIQQWDCAEVMGQRWQIYSALY